jgi:hypothetical protein
VSHPFYGVNCVDVGLDDPAERARAFVVKMPAAAVFSHGTAASILGAPLPAATIARPIDVAVPWPKKPPRGRGIVGHALRPDAIRPHRYRGMPITSPADTWCQLSTELTKNDLVAVGDYLLSGNPWHGADRRPFVTMEQLRVAAARYSGKRGARTLAWALPLVRPCVDSRPESHLRLLLISAGIPEPLIGDPTSVAGGLILRPDLKLPTWKIVLEYEGEAHAQDVRRFRNDIARRELFEDAGWRVIRVTADDLYLHPEELIGRVRRAIVARS